MWYLMSQFWLWLLVALIIGGVVGWMTFQGRDENVWRGLWPWGILLGLGSLVAVGRLLPDGAGFWGDLGMLLIGSYFIGCFIGYLLRFGRAEPAMAPAGIANPVMARELPVEPAQAQPAKAPEPEGQEEAILGLSQPRGGRRDNLTCIYGIDDAMENRLNGLGIYHHDQLASLSPGQRRWLFRQLGYEGRFPSWWWRWKYDAEQIFAGKLACPDRDATLTPASLSVPAAPLADGHQGARPSGLDAPRGGKADDLKRIRGIGKQNEGRLHALGIWHFDQIAAWSKEEVTWVGSYLAFPGRIEREEWVSQAKVLATGAETEFSQRVAKGLVATSADGGDQGQGNVAKLNKPVTPKPKT
jgi:predicted flap endonuclease-1-like 5' DNA nuclease